MATVQDPSTAVVLVPGATAKEPGLHAVAILRITIPEPPAPPPQLEEPPPPPPPPVLTVPGVPSSW